MTAMLGGAGNNAEELVVEEWKQRLDADIAAALASSGSPTPDGLVATRVETALGQGSSWSAALHDVSWNEGDLLAVGISSGPLGRLFLGSHAAKIVRSSPVPVMLLSRN